MNDPSSTRLTGPGSLPDPVFIETAPVCEVDPERRFGSLGRAFGADVLDVLARSHVVVAGIGGVGSWAVEALARSAVGRLTLVDMDHVAESNINRQVHALDSTLGQSKVHAMAERVAQINPLCQVVSLDDFVTPDNVQTTIPPGADVVLDCTDHLHAKVAMVLCARSRQQSLIVCGAAGGKTDALSLRRGDLRDATHDPLLARLRQTLRKQHGYASARGRRIAPMGVSVLWLEQPVTRPDKLEGGSALACAGYGSLVTVTASMGLAAAAFAIERISAKAE
ncbi:tRNA threonylcarbamoyladenosine dehydratase [Orrella marina]|uniref:tRNA threonylcarbamoyladenosine dehydratase n=1 Tax=Orrella marina TaxID=2163011 RepID=A0A2R4XPK9_9BURK|nr:tRNA threonylcarbamoyladenosine dehydratase [Orrella marina]AWB35715.1 tRNA threonylcarbamoyladenosine dehydratase [Orrella marina]